MEMGGFENTQNSLQIKEVGKKCVNLSQVFDIFVEFLTFKELLPVIWVVARATVKQNICYICFYHVESMELFQDIYSLAGFSIHGGFCTHEGLNKYFVRLM